MEISFPTKSKKIILALGPESAGNFSVYKNGKIFFSDSFGDLLEEDNFFKFKKNVSKYLRGKKIKPDIVLTDFHPLYVTTVWGGELAKKFKAEHIKVQHHVSHIFSAIGEKIIDNCKLKIDNCFGIAADGTGFGLDGNIWGGEVFQLSIKRAGHLENQVLIGGDLAVKEPARMLVAILAKISNFKFQISNKKLNVKIQKDHIFGFVKNFYSRPEFEVLYSQLQQNFNCVETSSTGRILDAVSVLLGFAGNKRKYKHEPVDLLEVNSSKPYSDIKPKIVTYKNHESGIMNYELGTTFLFEYLIKNLHKDKKRLAATAQMYIAHGLNVILNKAMRNEESRATSHKPRDSSLIAQNDKVFFAGGMANNKIISAYLEKQDIYLNKKIPRGDAGLSFGQLIYFLLS